MLGHGALGELALGEGGTEENIAVPVTGVAASGEVGEVTSQLATRVEVIGGAAAPLEALTSVGTMTGDASVTRGTVNIVPTLYPGVGEPHKIISVEPTYIVVDTTSAEYQKFMATMAELVTELRKSNEMASEATTKALAEIKAGLEILNAPKPDPGYVKLLLLTPLQWFTVIATSAVIGELAKQALTYVQHILVENKIPF